MVYGSRRFHLGDCLETLLLSHGNTDAAHQPIVAVNYILSSSICAYYFLTLFLYCDSCVIHVGRAACPSIGGFR